MTTTGTTGALPQKCPFEPPGADPYPALAFLDLKLNTEWTVDPDVKDFLENLTSGLYLPPAYIDLLCVQGCIYDPSDFHGFLGIDYARFVDRLGPHFVMNYLHYTTKFYCAVNFLYPQDTEYALTAAGDPNTIDLARFCGCIMEFITSYLQNYTTTHNALRHASIPIATQLMKDKKALEVLYNASMGITTAGIASNNAATATITPSTASPIACPGFLSPNPLPAPVPTVHMVSLPPGTPKCALFNSPAIAMTRHTTGLNVGTLPSSGLAPLASTGTTGTTVPMPAPSIPGTLAPAPAPSAPTVTPGTAPPGAPGMTPRATVPDPTDPAITKKYKTRIPIGDKCVWDGKYASVCKLCSYLHGHFLQIGCGYFIHAGFLELYMQHGADVLDLFPNLNLTPAQFEYDISYVYGVLQTVFCYNGDSYVQQYESTQDGFALWCSFLEHYDDKGDKDSETNEFEAMLQTHFRNYDGPLSQFVNEINRAFIRLAGLDTDYDDITCLKTLLRQASTPSTQWMVDHCKQNKLDYKASFKYLHTKGREIEHLASLSPGHRRHAKSVIFDDAFVDEGENHDHSIYGVSDLTSHGLASSSTIAPALWNLLEPATRADIIAKCSNLPGTATSNPGGYTKPNAQGQGQQRSMGNQYSKTAASDESTAQDVAKAIVNLLHKPSEPSCRNVNQE